MEFSSTASQDSLADYSQDQVADQYVEAEEHSGAAWEEEAAVAPADQQRLPTFSPFADKTANQEGNPPAPGQDAENEGDAHAENELSPAQEADIIAAVNEKVAIAAMTTGQSQFDRLEDMADENKKAMGEIDEAARDTHNRNNEHLRDGAEEHQDDRQRLADKTKDLIDKEGSIVGHATKGVASQIPIVGEALDLEEAAQGMHGNPNATPADVAKAKNAEQADANVDHRRIADRASTASEESAAGATKVIDTAADAEDKVSDTVAYSSNAYNTAMMKAVRDGVKDYLEETEVDKEDKQEYLKNVTPEQLANPNLLKEIDWPEHLQAHVDRLEFSPAELSEDGMTTTSGWQLGVRSER